MCRDGSLIGLTAPPGIKVRRVAPCMTLYRSYNQSLPINEPIKQINFNVTDFSTLFGTLNIHKRLSNILSPLYFLQTKLQTKHMKGVYGIFRGLSLKAVPPESHSLACCFLDKSCRKASLGGCWPMCHPLLYAARAAIRGISRSEEAVMLLVGLAVGAGALAPPLLCAAAAAILGISQPGDAACQ